MPAEALPAPSWTPPFGAAPRMAIVGIGSELRGDDAAGLEVARRLRPSAADRENLLVIEAGPAPEAFTGTLRHFRPELVVLVDAARMDTSPGSVLYLNWREVDGFRGSTHTLPLSTLASYLEKEIGCEVWLLGIQPACTEFDRPLTPDAARGVHLAVENLRGWLAL